MGIELGSDFLIPVGERLSDKELYGKYGLSLMYLSTSGFYLQAELLGIANITNGDNSFDNSTFHTYALGAGYNGYKVGAGLYYRNYLDDLLSDNFKGILGIEFNYFLSRI